MTYYQHAWYSADGVHWNRGITPLDATLGVRLTGVEWDPSNLRFVAARSIGPSVYSADGIHWSSASSPSVSTAAAQLVQPFATDGSGLSVWFGQTGSSTAVMEYSTDAINWALATNPTGPYVSVTAAAWDQVASRFLAAQWTNINALYASTNGSTWSAVSTTGFPNFMDCLTGFAGQTLGVAQNLVNSQIYQSTDGGFTWSSVYTLPGIAGFGGSQFAFSGSLYELVGTYGSGGGAHLSSPDGVTWTNFGGPGTNSIAWSPALGLWATSGNTGASDADLWTSPDGLTWTQRHVDPSATWTVPAQSIAWSPHLNLFVFVGEATYTNPPGGGGGWQLGNTTWAGATAGWGAATGQ